MSQPCIALIGYQDQENLGIGYLASMAHSAGFSPHILDYRLGVEELAEILQRLRPIVAGFSIIFQYYTPDFQRLARYFRERGITCHFTAGGHYPSLRPQQILETFPELDSVVLFEGEHTFVELIQALSTGKEWRNIPGLAHRMNGTVVTNFLRPLVADLDTLPVPVRPPLRVSILGKKQTALLASRGCLYNCSFCSIRNFYSKPPGPLKRLRRPEMVVQEMALLHRELDCSIFLFQDDDFPGAARNGANWAGAFAEALEHSGLAGRVIWKISCRSDEVDAERFARLRDIGLSLVYLGIEAGTEPGLRLMNKHLTVESHRKAVDTLNRLGINWDFGFMMFDPESTYQSVLGNLNFLEAICADGSSPVTACKMIPYAETAIERRLEESRRLLVHGQHLDYRFFDPGLDELYSFFVDAFSDWIESRHSVLALARCARYSIVVYRHFYGGGSALDDMAREVRRLTAAANRLFLDTMRQAVVLFEDSGGSPSMREKAGLHDRLCAGRRLYETTFLKTIQEIERRVPGASDVVDPVNDWVRS